MTPSSPHVLVFDSGVGALSIIEHIRARLPASVTYASDTAYFPYGVKGEDELVERVDQVLRSLVQRCAPDIVVVACNTASTVALPRVREHFELPIVGVVPAIRPAAQASRSKVIGLLGTPATVKRPYTDDLIRQFAADCLVLRVGSSELVNLAEEKLRGRDVDSQVIQSVFDQLNAQEGAERLDTIVLACTHFPLLLDELEACCPRPVQWVDSGEAIARRVAYWIDQLELSARGPMTFRSVFTARPAELEAFRSRLETYVPGPVECWAL